MAKSYKELCFMVWKDTGASEIVQKLKQGIPPETFLAQRVDEGVIRKAMSLL